MTLSHNEELENLKSWGRFEIKPFKDFFGWTIHCVPIERSGFTGFALTCLAIKGEEKYSNFGVYVFNGDAFKKEEIKEGELSEKYKGLLISVLQFYTVHL